MSEPEPQYDYPVEIDSTHRVKEPVGYDGDKFECGERDAYTHTGGWPAWNFCPFCGEVLE